MATIYGSLNPPAAATYAGSSILNGTAVGADGDVFVRNSLTNPLQWRFSATPAPVWTQIVPPNVAAIGTWEGPPTRARGTLSDNRADVVPRGGLLNERVAKVANLGAGVSGENPWALGWANAAEGVVMAHHQSVPALNWSVAHDLSSQWVDVTVISPGSTNPTAIQRIVVPEIYYEDLMKIVLTFLEPIAGTAIVRR